LFIETRAVTRIISKMKAKRTTRDREKVVVEFNPSVEPRIASALLDQSGKGTPVSIKKIMATTDFSEFSRLSIEYAQALAQEFRAALSLVNVVAPPVKLAGTGSLLLARSDDQVFKIEKRHLSKLAVKLSGKGKPIKPISRYGKAVKEITEAAREEGMDLIVTGTHGYTGLRRVLIGSTAEGVVRHAPCPVITVPAECAEKFSGKRWAARIHKIVVPIDFSETSLKALPYALEFAKRFRAEVVLVHVVEPVAGYGAYDYVPSPAVEAEMKRAAEELLSRVQREAFPERTCTEVMIRYGVPFQEIARAVTHCEGDLLILTTHGLTGFSHALLGSTAERVVRHASCPVLVVRDRKADS
jgi:nucleotide-binding universal stress UspA family protein